MPEPDFFLKRGDTSSSIASTLENSGGTAINIQGATVRFKMAPIGGGTLTIDAAATNAQNGTGVDGSMGQVAYVWATVAATASLYVGEWEVTYSGGSVQTYPNDSYVLIEVAPDLPFA